MDRLSRTVVGVGVLAGCGRIDFSPTEVSSSLVVERRSIGASVVSAPEDLTGSTATFLVADPRGAGGFDRFASTETAPGTWTATAPTLAQPLFALADNARVPVDLALSAPAIKFIDQRLEHPGATAMQPGATFQLDVTLPTSYAGEALSFYTVGSWALYELAAADLPANGAGALTVTIPSSKLGPAGTDTQLDRITTADRAMVLRYVSQTLTGVYLAPPFDQTGADTISGTMVAVTQDQTLSVTIDPSGVLARLAAAAPANTTTYLGWELSAAPGASLGDIHGPQLLQADVAPTDPGAIDIPFGNPFESLGWLPSFEWVASTQRMYTPSGLPAVALAASLVEIAEPSAGMNVEMPVGLATAAAIGPQGQTQALVNDGMTVHTDPTRPVEIAMTVDRAVDQIFSFYVYEVTATGPTLRFSVVALTTDVVIPPDAFVAGHTYYLELVCFAGLTTAANGDLTLQTQPLVVGAVDSMVFTVASP